MSPSVRSSTALAMAIAALASMPSSAAGQNMLSAHAGVSSYDLSGTGTTGVVATRFDRALTRILSIQAGVGLFWYETQGGGDVAMLLPEMGLVLRAPGRVPLYVAAGAGHTIGLSGPGDDDVTLHAALGYEQGLSGGWALSPEFRLRIVDPWVGTQADFTLGVRYHLGG